MPTRLPTLSKPASEFLEKLAKCDRKTADQLVKRIRNLRELSDDVLDKPIEGVLGMRYQVYSGYRIVYFQDPNKIMRIEKLAEYV